jgi:hypothetical protein
VSISHSFNKKLAFQSLVSSLLTKILSAKSRMSSVCILIIPNLVQLFCYSLGSLLLSFQYIVGTGYISIVTLQISLSSASSISETNDYPVQIVHKGVEQFSESF